jgi:hypothetical protein
VTAGASMIAIDTLVHNWLHRSGILKALSAEHTYGVGCYRAGGCAEIIERVAIHIDATRFNSAYPRMFPRFVQKAIWSFCASEEMDQCNGNRVNDRRRCGLIDCSIHGLCRRVVLAPAA